jgi:signal transduction histidine kinase
VKAFGALSLRWKVPALIALLICLAVGAFGLVAYVTVRRSVLDAAVSHQRAAAGQVAELLVGSSAGILRQLGTAADHPAVLAALRSPAAPVSDSLDAVLRRLAPEGTGVWGVELVDARGRTVLARGLERTEEAPPPWTPPPDSVGLSPFFGHGDRLAYEVSAPVRERGRVVGRITQIRIVRAGSAATRAISDLIGGEATLLFGNADGSRWTDLERTVTGVDAARGGRYVRDGRVLLGATTVVPGTPWAIAVETPELVALAPLRSVVWRFAVLGLLIIAGGAVAGDRLSRAITRPLGDLTNAAEAIAGGDLQRRDVRANRSDEIGRLARAFGAMSDSVHQVQDHLESMISVRTAELERALTRLRDAQEELLRKERLAMLGQLSSSIGHELRNPLGVMLNAVYFLEMTMPDSSPASPKAREYLALLREQIRLSERIVSDLLDSARTRPPQRSAVAVEPLVTDHASRVTMPERIRFEYDVAPDVPRVFADPDQVGQILVNLLTNGVQAMDGRGGTLTVRARERDGRVRIDVQDTGEGVPAEHMGKIFEPLFTTRARGIGLGLSVSRTLARANAGDLTVMNDPGGGAVFTLDLPAAGPT